MKCPECGKELPDFYRLYVEAVIHEIHVGGEKALNRFEKEPPK